MLKLKQRKCESCRQLYMPKRNHQRFCSPGCRNDFHNNNNSRIIEDLKIENQLLRDRLLRAGLSIET